MTALGAKLIWAEATKHCSEERFIRAIELVREKAATKGGLGTTELQAHQEALQRMALGEDKLQTWRSTIPRETTQGRPVPRQSPRSENNNTSEVREIVTLD